MENVYRGKDCMKKFCVYLKTHAMKIISFQKEEDKVMNKRRAAIIWKCKNLLYLSMKILKKYLKDEKCQKVRDHCCYTGKHRGTTHIICNLKSNFPKTISLVFHNGSNYIYHFII